MKILAVAAFVSGLLLAVRVMFFGVQRRVGEDRLLHRRWPLSLAAFLSGAGAGLYAVAARGGTVTVSAAALVVLIGVVVGAAAWWFVHHSASLPSTDPEDDPRYRFQGHVARVVKAMDVSAPGRVTFTFDGREYDLAAQWTPEMRGLEGTHGREGDEVVIERIEGDVAFVEPWVVVEQRL